MTPPSERALSEATAEETPSLRREGKILAAFTMSLSLSSWLDELPKARKDESDAENAREQSSHGTQDMDRNENYRRSMIDISHFRQPGGSGNEVGGTIQD